MSRYSNVRDYIGKSISALRKYINDRIARTERLDAAIEKLKDAEDDVAAAQKQLKAAKKTTYWEGKTKEKFEELFKATYDETSDEWWKMEDARKVMNNESTDLDKLIVKVKKYRQKKIDEEERERQEREAAAAAADSE